ncbi:MAG: DUF523 domain-containing protein [Elusimicrobiales bacterium]|jgi:uncharacterized protein YbbK (DUF523 family)|nr:DUF523 domain-containing protein [Elusimicrobiales bacterium]
MAERETLLVSACLLGVRCRYDGGEEYLPEVARLMERYDLVAVCPEALGGMPAPRTPAEIRGARVVSIDGEDRTEKFRLGAERALELARKFGARKALLKSRSPSCGSGRVYDGTFSGNLAPGKGVAAALLEEEGIEVFSEHGIAVLP